MTARRHVSSVIESSLHRVNCSWTWPGFSEDEFDGEISCIWCGRSTDCYKDPGLWDLSFNDFARIHERNVNDEDSVLPPPGDPHVILSNKIDSRYSCLHVCPWCGWWLAEDRALLPAVRWQYWVIALASASALEDFSLDNIDIPIMEVRRYLMRKFNARKSMHPRLFELTVASVFRDHGYEAVATAYSKDGGIDVVMTKDGGDRIGVQVKRYGRSVGVEQIRSFLGALVIGEFSRGVFVSSSGFTGGASEASRQSYHCGMPIDLIDAARFFDMLEYAQLKSLADIDNCGIKDAKKLVFQSLAHYHLNSL